MPVQRGIYTYMLDSDPAPHNIIPRHYCNLCGVGIMDAEIVTHERWHKALAKILEKAAE